MAARKTKEKYSARMQEERSRKKEEGTRAAKTRQTAQGPRAGPSARPNSTPERVHQEHCPTATEHSHTGTAIRSPPSPTRACNAMHGSLATKQQSLRRAGHWATAPLPAQDAAELASIRFGENDPPTSWLAGAAAGHRDKCSSCCGSNPAVARQCVSETPQMDCTLAEHRREPRLRRLGREQRVCGRRCSSSSSVRRHPRYLWGWAVRLGGGCRDAHRHICASCVAGACAGVAGSAAPQFGAPQPALGCG